MILDALLLVLGLVILTGGAELLVRGGTAVAERLGVSQLLIGLTVISFGTSAPELAVSIKAGLANQGGIAIGNVIGSNIFNASLILGVAAVICPLRVHLNIIKRELPVLLVVTVLFSAILLYRDGLSRLTGTVLVAGIIFYTILTARAEKRLSQTIGDDELSSATPDLPEAPRRLVTALLLIAAGLGMLVFGAKMFVENAVTIASSLGVSDAVIGLTVVAAGTSLPELAASAMAAFRGKADMAIGNIVGSNLFNLLCIAGVTSMISPLDAGGIRWFDIGAMLVTSLLLLPLMWTGFRLSRWEGVLLIASFGAYMFVTWP